MPVVTHTRCHPLSGQTRTSGPAHGHATRRQLAHTDKQNRQAAHIEDSERKQGRSRDDAGGIAWATVNKQDGGGKASGSGRKRPRH